MNIIYKQAAPNTYQAGRLGNPVQYIIIHAMDSHLVDANAAFTSGSRGTSAHFGIEDATVYQWVKTSDTAYQAGDLLINYRSIGIEHSADPQRPASEATYETSAALIAQLCTQFNIPVDRDHIKMHREVSDEATECPVNVDIDIIMQKVKEIMMFNEGDRVNINIDLYGSDLGLHKNAVGLLWKDAMDAVFKGPEFAENHNFNDGDAVNVGNYLHTQDANSQKSKTWKQVYYDYIDKHTPAPAPVNAIPLEKGQIYSVPQ